MSYKIYKRNNQVFIDNTETGKNFSGKISKISIAKSPNGLFNFTGFGELF